MSNISKNDNHYSILELPMFSSSSKLIKQAFRLKICKYHPDKFQQQKNICKQNSNMKQQSIKIIEAYKCLMNNNEKQKYDQILSQQIRKQSITHCRFKHLIDLQQKKVSNPLHQQTIEKQQSPTLSPDSELTEEQVIIITCQQCECQNQINIKQLENQSNKDKQTEICLNCSLCGIYMTFEY